MFLCRPSFCVFHKMFIKVPYFYNLSPLPWKIAGWALVLRHCSFCKTTPLKCLTMFWIHLCLNKCSVICSVTLCFILHQTHLELWHIQHSVCSDICRHIQLYSALLRHIHPYLDIIKAFSGLFRRIQQPV